MLIPLLFTLLAAHSIGGAQQPAVAGAATFDIRGIVTREGTPLQGSVVDLRADTTGPSLRSTATDSDGRFLLKDIVEGDYWIRARFIGHGPAMQKIRVDATTESVVLAITMTWIDFWKVQEEARFAAHRAALAEARTRPRRWTCDTSAAETRRHAQAWAYLAKPARETDPDERGWGVPTDSLTFVKTFQPIRDRSFCIAFARRLDAEFGLIHDHLLAYRIGKVFLVPELHIIADSTGKVLAVFVY